MTDVTTILTKLEQGNVEAADDLLPLVYEELRKLAKTKLSNEKPGQTLQATALVHEAYLRLVDHSSPQKWEGRGHFFAAAAESMRRILVERARRRKSEKHGGRFVQVEFSERVPFERDNPEEILALSDAIDVLAGNEPEAAELVKLRLFADFSVEEAGKLIGLSRATAYRHWTYARAWLKTQMAIDENAEDDEKKPEIS